MANRLILYFTSDTHGYIYPTDFISSDTLEQGLLRMRFPKDGNTLVLDGGDTLQGSPLTYYCHANNQPMPCSRVMNDLEYDDITIVNHDLNYGYETLLTYLRNSNAQCLCANITDHTGQLPILPYTVRMLKNGLRVGLIGITTHWINIWERPENLTRLTVSDTMQAAQEAVEALRGKTDLLIGLYHGGFERDLDTGKRVSDTDENISWQLCEELPFDILLTGHQHLPVANQVIHGTHIAQTPGNAKAFVRLIVDDNGTISSRLYKPDAPLALKPWERTLYTELNHWLDTPIGRLSRPLLPQARLEMALYSSPIADFINRVQLDASGAQISCVALSNDICGFQAQVTVRDVVSSYPFSNTLVVLRVSGRTLREALEQCATYFRISADGSVAIDEAFIKPKAAHYNYDYFYGIAYTFDLRNPVGNRVTGLSYQGNPIHEEDNFSLVMSNYRATGAGNFNCYLSCLHIKEIQTEVSELILDYLRKNTPVNIPHETPYTVILPKNNK
jgi:2',3'-cyclic-nucleotide 2'-phosphodiesterase / 3'-nucleotidase